MNVGRTTVQRLYKDARRTLATFLVEGLCLNIEGGVFELCGRDRAVCRQECRCKSRDWGGDSESEDVGDNLKNDLENAQNERF